ncbi:hypothetical protein BOC43_22575 [Burkholderia pseudomallei]|nr:hypothetical protein BOC43_22575 [Burkholderia pseudomallei]
MDNRANSRLNRCATDVDVNGVTPHGRTDPKKLPIETLCGQTGCASGYAPRKCMIRRRKRRLSTEKRGSC